MAGEILLDEASKSKTATASQSGTRGRILEAAFCVLMEHGYAGATTREIAARAKVSKRELYALFGSKQGILAALIEGRSSLMRMPLAASANLRTRADLASVLTRYGANLLREVFQPAPLAMHRLALAETERSPEMARILDEGGRNANLRSMIAFLAAAKDRGLLRDVDPEIMAGRFFTLLWGDRLMRVLMRVADVPQTDEIQGRAEAATADFMKLYPSPEN
jgi:AcrR family transcriptional regulator